MSTKKFVSGMIVKEHVWPDGNVELKVSLTRKTMKDRQSFPEWIRDNWPKEQEWLNLKIKKGRTGNWYAEVDTWKPKQNDERQMEPVAKKGGEVLSVRAQVLPESDPEFDGTKDLPF